MKRTKVYDGIIPLHYVKLIEEDHYDISNYLSLSRDIKSSLNTNIMGCALTYGGFQIFNKNFFTSFNKNSFGKFAWQRLEIYLKKRER